MTKTFIVKTVYYYVKAQYRSNSFDDAVDTHSCFDTESEVGIVGVSYFVLCVEVRSDFRIMECDTHMYAMTHL